MRQICLVKTQFGQQNKNKSIAEMDENEIIIKTLLMIIMAIYNDNYKNSLKNCIVIKRL